LCPPHAPQQETRMSHTPASRTLPARMPTPRNRRHAALIAGAAALALALAGCSGDAGSHTAPDGWTEPDYAGAPTDLTSEQVCALLDDADFATHLGVEITGVKPGEYN